MTSRVLIFAIHRTAQWWRYLGQNLGLGDTVVVSDVRGEGDCSIVDDFGEAVALRIRSSSFSAGLISADDVGDIIARCRVLRGLPYTMATAMIQAMAEAIERQLAAIKPTLILSLPIDRYVTDILERRAAANRIPYLQLATSMFAGMAMFLQRGALVLRPEPPAKELVEGRCAELIDPAFVPTYVAASKRYSVARYLRSLAHFRLRGFAFWAIGILKRDALNFHYLEARASLAYKNRLSDLRILELIDRHWRSRIDSTPRDRRVLFGLQLYPEASIDYWINDRELVAHEDCVFEAAQAFSREGYTILVKDHPLQFGFRRVNFIERLLSLKNVVFLPYEVSGQSLLQEVGVNFTFTGTLGLQAALSGIRSIATDCYYTTAEDFIIYRKRPELASLPHRVAASGPVADLQDRRRRIVSRLLQGSFEGDMFSFKGFDSRAPSVRALSLANSMGRTLRELSDADILKV